MSGKIKTSIGLRIVLIVGLTLLLLIPTVMIESLITEREQRRNESVAEINSKWGASQVITGPILTIPYKTYYKDSKMEYTTTNYLHLLPDYLSVNGNLKPEIRYRGIYKSVLYNAGLNFEGKIMLPDFEKMNIRESDVLWNAALVSINISDMKGIKDIIKVKWNDNELIENPGLESNDVLQSGVSTRVVLDPKIKTCNFLFRLNVNGSDEIKFLPIGKETSVKIHSKWNNPSFTGDFLPVKRLINQEEFTSEWRVLNLNRNYPQKWINKQYNIFTSSFGVKMLLPIDEYQITMRTAKYAIMFIGLTFLAFFVIEILNKRILHPVQYLLIGFAIVLFYTLLLALSENISFNISYWIAAIAITVLIAAYTKSILSSKRLSIFIFGILLSLYGFLFVILQLQDYALLVGSIGLFVILSMVMYITRKIDWYSIAQNDNAKDISLDRKSVN